MDDSALEALMTGVYVLIFIVALSIAIMLMNTVLDAVTVANDMVKDPTPGGTMSESQEEYYENIIRGEDLLKYVDKLNEFTELDRDYVIKIDNKEIRDYFTINNISTIIGKQYKYKYEGKLGNKYIINFSEI